MFRRLLCRLQGIRLIWKLLIPFLLLSFSGTTLLVCIGLGSQEELIRREEKKELTGFYRVFLQRVERIQEQALSLAEMVSDDPKVQALLAAQDRKNLLSHIQPVFERLQALFGIQQLHLHIPPGKSFLRLHRPAEFGEIISSRKTVRDALKLGRGVSGLEWGNSGLAVRGIAPVHYNGTTAGSLEIGFPFDREFLQKLKEDWGPEFTVFDKRGGAKAVLLASSRTEAESHSLHELIGRHRPGRTDIFISPEYDPDTSILVAPLRGYSGSVAAIVKIEADRAAINSRLADTRRLMILVGVSGVIVSFLLVWLVSLLFTRPIREIVERAREIAEEGRETRLEPRPDDEIGQLTRSLNAMLESLIKRRKRIQEYALTLERRVAERTADLVASEEKYRTLVEHLPLIVYRLLPDGTTEFVNPYFTKKLGYSAEEAVGNRNFWKDKICGSDWIDGDDMLTACFQKGEVHTAERVVNNKKGRALTFIDSAVPVMDESGKVEAIDGTMVDISRLKELQDQAVRTEEIRVMGVISSRLAHEIRNPVATAGGFARRLHDSLPEGSKPKEFAGIILKEVSRLEEILEIMLCSIRPLNIAYNRVDLKGLLRSILREQESKIHDNGINLEEALPEQLPEIMGDEGLLKRALENILKTAILSGPRGQKLSLSASAEDDHILVMIKHREDRLSDEDLDQFFFPRVTSECSISIEELPLSRVIVHRHGGVVEAYRQGEDVVFRLELPYKPPAGNESGETCPLPHD